MVLSRIWRAPIAKLVNFCQSGGCEMVSCCGLNCISPFHSKYKILRLFNVRCSHFSLLLTPKLSLAILWVLVMIRYMFHVLDTQDFPIQQLKLLLWGLLSVDPPGKSIMPYVVTTKVAESGTPPSVHFAGRPELVAHTHILLPNLKKHISMFPRLSHLI